MRPPRFIQRVWEVLGSQAGAPEAIDSPVSDPEQPLNKPQPFELGE